MRLTLTEDEELVATTAQRILQRVTPTEIRAKWGLEWIDGPYKALGEVGMLELGIFPKSADESLASQAVVLAMELGRHAYLSPFMVSLGWCGTLFSLLGNQTDKVSALSSGEMTCALAVLEGRLFLDGLHRPKTRIVRASGGMRLQGRKKMVQFADVADEMLVTAMDGHDLVLVLLKRQCEGLACHQRSTVSGDLLFDVELDVAVPGDAVIARGPELAQALDRAMAHVFMLQSAYLVGGAERALAVTTAHVIQREQFGQPLGSFQAVQHHVANSRSSVDAGRLMVFELAWRASTKYAHLRALAAETKAWIAETTGEVLRRAHELQGGISVVDLHETVWHFRRNLSESLQFGSPPELWPLAFPLRTVGPGVQGLGVN